MSGVELASAEIENRLISCLINHRMAPATALSLGLSRDDYAWEVNALIHDAILRIVERGHAIDDAILIQELDSSDHLQAIGGAAVIQSLTAAPHDANLLTEYVTTVRDRAMRRSMMRGLEECARVLQTEPDGHHALELAQDVFFRSADRYTATAFSGLEAKDLRAAWEVQGGGVYIPFPFESQNTKLIGQDIGTLTIIGAYSSDGKSVYGNLATVRSCAAGAKTALITLEMSREQVTKRLLVELTGITMGRFDQMYDPKDPVPPTFEELELIDAAFDTMETWDFKLYCDPNITIADIKALQMRERFDHIIVDYLQRFDFSDFHEIPRMARQLKNVALGLRTRVTLLSQLTPGQISQGDNPYTKPHLTSLYGGKATSNEADYQFYIWALRRPDEHGSWVRTGEGLLICSKARQGEPEWEVPIMFNGEHVRWYEP